MNSNAIVAKIIAALQQCNIPFMVVGSFSSNIYGIERSTQDVDIVLELGSHPIGELTKALGPDFRLDPQMGFETVTMTSRYIAHHIDPYFKIELFLLSDDPHDQQRFARRRAFTSNGLHIDYPTPEDVLITKLRWSKGGKRTKDIEDAKNVFTVQHEKLDLAYIRHWCAQHGTLELFENTLASLPPMA